MVGVPRRSGEGAETGSNSKHGWEGAGWKVGRLAVTRKASGDIDGSTKEVEGRWGDEQQQQHGRAETCRSVDV